MAKRAKKKMTHILQNEKMSSGHFDPQFTGLSEERDQRYVKNIKPRSDNQAKLIDAIDNSHLTFAVGPAGTGKTYLAIAKAVEALEKGEIYRLILSRPAIGAGEDIGYLPGDISKKLDPYLRPLYDALNERLGPKKLQTYLANGTIEIAPIAYMRGRTLNKSFIIIDEAQNCTYGQIKMILTRLGWNSTMIVTGDPGQSDLLDGMSGLSDIVEKLKDVDGIETVQLNDQDVVRHPLVASMISVL